MAKRLSWANGAWLLLYLATIAGVVTLLIEVRNQQVAQLSSRASQAEWQHWRSAVELQSKSPGPVERKVPKSSEPPSLILLRDHFPVLLIFGVIFATAFFCMAMFVLRGMLRNRKRPQSREAMED